MARDAVTTGTEFPVDNRGQRVELLAFGKGRSMSITTSSVRIALLTDTRVFTVSTDVSCWLKFGDDTVVADSSDDSHDVYIPANGSADLPAPASATHLAGLGIAEGTLHISGRY